MKKFNTGYMVQLAVLTAIIVLMAFTPLGYLKAGLVEITFIMIPVVVGAVVLGPAAGAILGGIFGLTSFIQCFGMSAFGVMLMGVSPLRTFIVCVFARIIAGWLPGLIFQRLKKVRPGSLLAYGAACLSGALLNTILFVGLLALLFSDTMLGMATAEGISMLAFMLTFVSLNSVIEMAVCLVAGTAVAKAVHRAAARI